MAELYSFLDGTFADIRSKLDLEYQRRLSAHEARISVELSAEDYTPNYGKIDIDAAFRHFLKESCSHCSSQTTPCSAHHPVNIVRYVGPPVGEKRYSKGSDLEADILPKGRWFIHYIARKQSHTGSSYSGGMTTRTSLHIELIDNYGAQYAFQTDGTNQSTFTCYGGSATSVPMMHRLPNDIIDLCKSFTYSPYVTSELPYQPGSGSAQTWNSIGSIQKLATKYYARFTALKPLFDSGRLVDYKTLHAENTTLKHELLVSREDVKTAAVREGELVRKSLEMERELTAIREEIQTLRTSLQTTSTAYSEQTVAVRSLATKMGATAATADPLRFALNQYKEQAATLQTVSSDLAAATKRVEQLRAENQGYVDTVFKQRQEITEYKKQLLDAPTAAASVNPTLEDLVARTVARMMAQQPPSENPTSE
jgi:hypothetical protein